MRRKGFVNEFVNVHVQGEAVYVSCDGGRVCRPLIICDKGVPRVKQEHITKLKTREAEGKCGSVEGTSTSVDARRLCMQGETVL